MSNVAIRVENLGKQYRLGEINQHKTLRETLTRTMHQPLRWLRGNQTHRTRSEKFWALRDVSFDVQRGEVIGIIGRNGAGKSTLLKVLSRITHPTTGRVAGYGRVGSLLEVGTGFHPELTGRENIYLNGAVLGMKREEINRKFDEIVAFSEVEKFLDTPVKHYSSGMYVRLAFSVAAHLEPEILIVDEVLAVGDFEFQKKCLGKMQNIAQDQGRTILFVSHDMQAIQKLCHRCLFLERGNLVLDGNTGPVVAHYLNAQAAKATPQKWVDLSLAERVGTGEAKFVRVRFESGDAALGYEPYVEGDLIVTAIIRAERAMRVSSIAATIYDASGFKLINADSVVLGKQIYLQPGENRVQFKIDRINLNAGRYRMGLWLADSLHLHRVGTALDHIQSAFELRIIEHPDRTSQYHIRPQQDGAVSCNFSIEQDRHNGRGGTA